MSIKRPCPDCGTLFAPRAKSALCLSCSGMANVIIRSMMTQGRTTREMAVALNLTETAVLRRRCRIASNTLKRPKLALVPPAAIVIEVRPKQAPKQKPGPKSRPICSWPSGNPAREMHVCCRVPETGDVRCDDAA